MLFRSDSLDRLPELDLLGSAQELPEGTESAAMPIDEVDPQAALPLSPPVDADESVDTGDAHVQNAPLDPPLDSPLDVPLEALSSEPEPGSPTHES